VVVFIVPVVQPPLGEGLAVAVSFASRRACRRWRVNQADPCFHSSFGTVGRNRLPQYMVDPSVSMKEFLDAVMKFWVNSKE